MHYLRSKLSVLAPIISGSLLVFIFMTGCTPAQTAALDAALDNLVRNKSLAEQFVRDVKTRTDPSDFTYQRLVQDYEAARASNDDYLNSVKLAALTNQPQTDLKQLSEDAQNAAAEFLASAVTTLRPTTDPKGIQFRRAMVFPNDLSRLLQTLPKNRRGQLIRQFENQVRWHSWRQL